MGSSTRISRRDWIRSKRGTSSRGRSNWPKNRRALAGSTAAGADVPVDPGHRAYLLSRRPSRNESDQHARVANTPSAPLASSVDWPVEDQWCHHLIVPQGSYERDRLPCSLRNVGDQSLATRAAAPDTDHINSDRSLIDKHQSRRIKKVLLPDPAPTRSRHVRSVNSISSRVSYTSRSR